jgi:RimJ/RimL family protein N-acetyltransferase
MLSGTDVALRRWRPSDVDDVVRICQDPEIQKWTMVPVPYTRSDAVHFTGELAGSGWDSGDSASFAVVDRHSGRLTGAITVLTFHEGVAEVGYWTAPEARGAGRTGQALRLITSWCFADRGCARVELTADVDNVGSRRVAESAGFVLEGIVRQRSVVKGRRIDSALYSRLPTDPATD